MVVAVLALAACGGESKQRADDPGRILTEQVGRGPQTAFIIRPDVEGPLPVVLFLHGWGATLPPNYRPWLDHLARRGNVVIYPRYQDSVLSPPDQVLGNLIAGTRLALAKADARPRSLVVVGHSAGGALSADYAAIAGQAGLPAPRAILSLYPGRSLRGVAASIPEVAPEEIPAATRIVALAGSRDTVVGTAPAQRIVASATRVPRGRRSYVLIRDPAVADHLGPQRAGLDSRRVFWERLDKLIVQARADRG
ncbi:MAG: alpha/beta hydrolase [Solirubrobacterales bacterium]|nr:alpha/beta hydrolase [Solirubrobacterales bacterium]